MSAERSALPDPLRRTGGHARRRRQCHVPAVGAIRAFRRAGRFRCSPGQSLNAAPPAELHFAAKGGAGARALIAVWDTPDEIKALKPAADLEAVLMQQNCGSLIATAPGGGAPYDMVSRFFAPYFGVPEDPVTGSAHCALTPFWAKRLGKSELKARQASAARRRSLVHRCRRAHHHPGQLRALSDGRNRSLIIAAAGLSVMLPSGSFSPSTPSRVSASSTMPSSNMARPSSR